MAPTPEPGSWEEMFRAVECVRELAERLRQILANQDG
jgi:hypothetical protein